MKPTFTPKQYIAELAFAVIAVFGLYLIIAWSSYSPIDNAWSISSYQLTTINKAGALGAWLIDIFFSLFGYVGNLLPFLCVIIPIYLIRSKKVKQLSWIKFFISIIGFGSLLIGLTILVQFSFSDSHYYLAGGVLGGWLTVALKPHLGEFGLLLLATCATTIGFLLCSGASLIRVLVRFYYWLTIKEQSQVTDNATNSGTEQHYPISAEPKAKKQSVENTMVNLANFARTEQKFSEQANNSLEQENNNLANSASSAVADIKIQQGEEEIAVVFNSAQTSVDLDNQFNFQTEADIELPKVSIAEDYQPVADLSNISSAMELSSELPEIPKVSLVQQNLNDLSNAEQVVAKVEPHSLSPHKLASLTDVMQNDDQPQNQGKFEAEVATVPDYKPYESTLIHPLLQPTPTHINKPTTPMPTLDLLDQHQVQQNQVSEQETMATAQHITQKLQDFGVKATVKGVLVGPVVTRYELELQPGVKASKVTSIDRDLARALSFNSIRVAEVIPGKPYIGIEVPNQQRQVVWLRNVLNSTEFLQSKHLLPMALGKDISGKPIVIDLAKTPHLLVAGSTGSGKSVGVNTMILSLLFKVKPDQVKFIMIDPKVVELSIYNDIPHLLTPVVTDMNKAANALRWCVEEMERRYQLLSKLYVRNIEGYNEKIDQAAAMNLPIPDPLWKPGDTMDPMPPALDKMSYIVVIVDEFADLMMVAGKQIEELIARLTQKARAVGIHVILATQRPSVDVITGLIKSNIPSRIAFTVVQRNDSRTILDQNGAEALLGKGDMLYLGNGTTDLVRVHGAFMTDDEVRRVADDWRAREKPHYIDAILENSSEEETNNGVSSDEELDGLFDEVVEFVVSTGTTSTSSIQRRFRVGFNRAARIMDQLEEQGIVSAMQNGKREVLARSSDY